MKQIEDLKSQLATASRHEAKNIWGLIKDLEKQSDTELMVEKIMREERKLVKL
jgi:hypothetical protein